MFAFPCSSRFLTCGQKGASSSNLPARRGRPSWWQPSANRHSANTTLGSDHIGWKETFFHSRYQHRANRFRRCRASSLGHPFYSGNRDCTLIYFCKSVACSQTDLLRSTNRLVCYGKTKCTSMWSTTAIDWWLLNVQVQVLCDRTAGHRKCSGDRECDLRLSQTNPAEKHWNRVEK